MVPVEKVLSLVTLYEKRLSHVEAKQWIPPVDDPLIGLYRGERLQHLKWQLAQIESIERTPAGVDEIHRVIGYIQGALWSLGFYTIEDLSYHNRYFILREDGRYDRYEGGVVTGIFPVKMPNQEAT